MKYLLDTAAFLYFIKGDEVSFTPRARKILSNPGNQFAVSVVSLWEIVIKYSLKKLELKKSPGDWLVDLIADVGWELLPVTAPHVLGVIHLEEHHKDPFDRLLISQARSEQFTLLTPDEKFRHYRVKLAW